MSNLTFNRINTVLSEEDFNIINTHIDALLAILPAKGMTPQERKSFRGMDVANKAFVEDCINALKMNGAETMPSYVNLDNLVNDLSIFEQLDKIKLRLKVMLSIVESTQRIAGKEAVDTARAVHGLYEVAAKSGVAGTKTSYAKLSERYKKQSGRKRDQDINKRS